MVRDRVLDMVRVPASALRANPKNWRLHPRAQRTALSVVLREIGIADVIIARQTDNGPEIIDGHLRQDILGDQLVPVIVLDVTEAEASALLLSLDPLAAMATADPAALDRVLREVRDKGCAPAIDAILADFRCAHGGPTRVGLEGGTGEQPEVVGVATRTVDADDMTVVIRDVAPSDARRVVELIGAALRAEELPGTVGAY